LVSLTGESRRIRVKSERPQAANRIENKIISTGNRKADMNS